MKRIVNSDGTVVYKITSKEERMHYYIDDSNWKYSQDYVGVPFDYDASDTRKPTLIFHVYKLKGTNCLRLVQPLKKGESRFEMNNDFYSEGSINILTTDSVDGERFYPCKNDLSNHPSIHDTDTALIGRNLFITEDQLASWKKQGWIK